jgi:hypothetical protein
MPAKTKPKLPPKPKPKTLSKAKTKTSPISRVDLTPITLLVPSQDLTIPTSLDPTQPPASILQTISAALSTSIAFLYTTDHTPIVDFQRLEPNTTLLIGTCYFERPLSEEEKDVILIQPGAATELWTNLPTVEKIEYITSLREVPHYAGAIYLTLTFDEFKTRMVNARSVRASLETIEENWELPIDAALGLQGMMKPFGEVETWDPALVSALGVLSEALVGQGDVVASLLIEEMKERVGKVGVVDARDVVEVGKELYQIAAW